MMLECLERLVNQPIPNDIYWSKSLEFGIRTVAKQHTELASKDQRANQAFENLMVKSIASPFEPIQASVLTAIAFDCNDWLISNRLLTLSHAFSEHPRLSRYWHQACDQVRKRQVVENTTEREVGVHPMNSPIDTSDESPPER
jgi:hypothetical protein